MTLDLLRAVGEALYGPRWQSDLSRDLNVADRTMRRWVAGTSDLPPGLAADLLNLCYKRKKFISQVMNKLFSKI